MICRPELFVFLRTVLQSTPFVPVTVFFSDSLPQEAARRQRLCVIVACLLLLIVGLPFRQPCLVLWLCRPWSRGASGLGLVFSIICAGHCGSPLCELLVLSQSQVPVYYPNPQVIIRRLRLMAARVLSLLLVAFRRALIRFWWRRL